MIGGAQATSDGSFGPWQEGPPLPSPRSDAAVLAFGGSAYVIGGYDGSGAPTSTTFVLTPDPQTGDLGSWKTAADAKIKLDLPGPLAVDVERGGQAPFLRLGGDVAECRSAPHLGHQPGGTLTDFSGSGAGQRVLVLRAARLR